MGKIRLVLIIVLFHCLRLPAQAPAWAWAKEANSPGQELANDACFDAASGSLFIAGSFDNNLSSYYGSAFTNAAGKKDAFVAKYSTAGTFGMAFKLGSADNDEIRGIHTDPFGNIYVCGYFENTIDFDPSSAVFNLSPASGSGKRDGFLAKYSPSGSFLWAVKMGGAQDDEAYKVFADSNAVYITGYYNTTPVFYSTTTATLGAAASQSNKNSFGAKYNAAGVVQWVVSAGSPKDDVGYSVIADKVNVYFTGIYNELLQFYSAAGTAAGTLAIQNNNKSDVYIASYSQSGGFNWVTNVSSSADDEAKGLTQDATSLYVAGLIGGTASFPYPSPVFTKPGMGGQDIFAAKLNKSNGVFQWTTLQTGSGSGDEGAYDIAKDASGSLLLTGFFRTNLNCTAWGGNLLTSQGGEDIFVTSLDPANGNFLWATSGGGNGDDVAYALTLDGTGVGYIAGEHKDAAVFGSYTLTNAGGSNIVAARLGCSSATIANNTVPASQTLCINTSPAQLMGSTPSGGTPPYSYLWQKSTDNITWVNATGTNTNKDYLPPLLSGSVYYRRKVSASGSCDLPSYSASTFIQADALPSIAVAAGNQTICAATATLSATFPVSGTGGWLVKTGSGIISNTAAAVSAVTQLSSGLNEFIWTVSNGVCPGSKDSLTIQVDIPPGTSYAGSDITVCSASAQLNASPPAAGTGQWSLVSGSGTIASVSLNQTSVNGLSAGINIFRWTTRNGVCPASTSSVIVSRDLPPTAASAGPDQSLEMPVTTLSANKPLVGTGMWTLISGVGVLENPNTPVTTFSEIGVGNNVVRWTISNGVCPASFSDATIYLQPLQIPSGYSPNGDNINDVFEIPGIDYYPRAELSVFNRWGNMVYHQGAYKNTWNGTNASGETLPDDTYYYTLSISEAMNYKGYILIKRDVK